MALSWVFRLGPIIALKATTNGAIQTLTVNGDQVYAITDASLTTSNSLEIFTLSITSGSVLLSHFSYTPLP